MNLTDLLNHPEHHSLEFKEVATPRVAKAVAAFASSRGGVVVVGVSDGDRRVVGLTEPAEVLAQKIQSWIHEYVSPPPPYEITYLNQGGQCVILITVSAGLEPAYAFEEQFYYRNNEQSQPIPASELSRRFADYRLAIELKALSAVVEGSHPARNTAAAFIGQGELATMSYPQLLARLKRDLSSPSDNDPA